MVAARPTNVTLSSHSCHYSYPFVAHSSDTALGESLPLIPLPFPFHCGVFATILHLAPTLASPRPTPWRFVSTRPEPWVLLSTPPSVRPHLPVISLPGAALLCCLPSQRSLPSACTTGQLLSAPTCTPSSYLHHSTSLTPSPRSAQPQDQTLCFTPNPLNGTLLRPSIQVPSRLHLFACCLPGPGPSAPCLTNLTLMPPPARLRGPPAPASPLCPAVWPLCPSTQ